MKKFINSKKGFTLVELVVCVAILGLIALTVMGLISTGTNMYLSVNKRTSVMYKAQAATAQLKSYIQNCSGVMGFYERNDGNVLFLTANDEDGDTAAYSFVFNSADKTIYIYTDKLSNILTGSQDEQEEKLKKYLTGDVGGEQIPLSTDVKNISYYIIDEDGNDVSEKKDTHSSQMISALKVKITLEKASQEYTKELTVAFRTDVEYVDVNTIHF